MSDRKPFSAPTWEDQLAFARTQPTDELIRHARVSWENRHRCTSCACCAAWTVMDERDRAMVERFADRNHHV